MQYRECGKTGERLSVLGFGCMRLPLSDPNDSGAIDETRAVAMLRGAIDAGVNYLDTAYVYHNGKSEELVGKALLDGYREKTNVATKLPVGGVQCAEDFDRLLGIQLKRLQTDRIDYYLLHALNNDNWEKRVLPFRLLDKLQEAKREGRVRNIGFSFHDDEWVFRKIIDGFDGWDFCQIQLNYIDCDYQAGLEGLKYAASRGLGVIVMEPLQGGKLANPTKEMQALLGTRDPVETALDYIWSFPEVSLLLSGMSTEEQVADNLRYAHNSRCNKLSPDVCALLTQVKNAYDRLATVPCHDCRYCMPCPHEVDIPGVFKAWNAGLEAGSRRLVKELYPDIEDVCRKCEKCGVCEKQCPQHIQISTMLRTIRERF